MLLILHISSRRWRWKPVNKIMYRVPSQWTKILICSPSNVYLIACLAVRDTCVKLVYQLYQLSGIIGRAGGLRALSGRQDGICFQPVHSSPFTPFLPSENGPLWWRRYLVLRRLFWHWAGAGAYLKGIFLPPLPPPPTPASWKWAKHDRQTAPQQPTHTKLILTRNLR